MTLIKKGEDMIVKDKFFVIQCDICTFEFSWYNREEIKDLLNLRGWIVLDGCEMNEFTETHICNPCARRISEKLEEMDDDKRN